MTRRRAVLAAVAVGALLVATAAAGGAVAAPAAPTAPAARPAAGDGVAHLVLRDVELTGIELGPATDPDSSPTGGAAAVVRVRVRDLRQAEGLRLGRSVPDGGLRVTTAGTSSADGLVLDATWACVRGLGVTSAGLLRGVLDDALNDALDVDPERGFRTTPVVVLANLVGALGVPVVIRELRADVAQLRAAGLHLPAGSIVRTTARAPAEGTCDSPDVPAGAQPVAEATLAQTSLTQLRTKVRELRRLPARLPSRSPSGPGAPGRQP